MTKDLKFNSFSFIIGIGVSIFCVRFSMIFFVYFFKCVSTTCDRNVFEIRSNVFTNKTSDNRFYVLPIVYDICDPLYTVSKNHNDNLSFRYIYIYIYLICHEGIQSGGVAYVLLIF